jgi:hypothetical protein
LIYLQRVVRQPASAVDLPTGIALQTYGSDTHRLFAHAIVRSYEGSLDCPALNGRRHIDDVIQGHKATGLFDPSLWYVLTEQDHAIGVLVLSPAEHNESVELVYLGLAPEGRGRGLGDLLMRLALDAIQKLDRHELNLAVDSKNLPALRLYYRHGMKRIGSRLALLRDLRPAPAASGRLPR